MDNLVVQRDSVLQGFENCYQKAKSDLRFNIKEHISTTLNNYDLDVINCEVPLKFIHPRNPSNQLDEKSSNQKKYINLQEPTITEKFFEENPPFSVSCFKKNTTDLFEKFGNLMKEKCPDVESSLKEFETNVETKTSDGVSINKDSDVHLFEKEMNDLNNFGLKVFNVYRPCLKNENIFLDDEKRDEFSAGVMRFQDLYGGCGANSESNFWNGLDEDEEKPKPIDDGKNEVSENIKLVVHPKNAEPATDDTPEKN